MKTNRRSYLAIAVAISILPGTFLGVSAQPRSSQYSVVKELKEGVIQVRVEGKSYLLLPVKPATIIEDETYVAATLASEGPIDSNETYLGLTTADAKEALKMKVDLDEAKQKLASWIRGLPRSKKRESSTKPL